MKKDCSNCARERFSIPCYDCLIGNNGTPSRWVEGDNYVPDTIAMRAIQQISRRAKEQDAPVPALLRRIGVSRELFWRWKQNKNDISACYLQQMALDGYDVVYILTGRRLVNARQIPGTVKKTQGEKSDEAMRTCRAVRA